ncbi:NADPH-dependent FMN reductase [Inquilinus limosus]|uniref:NADPH-dependent FMN reductase n=1 Tax=Inquilinus limosus TaxID=171674 RepID=UPI0003F5B09E|nr:NADPH-dependent FMN reductase [Inquilinus limosus]
MSNPVHILGLSGSLRRASLNTALLRAAGELLPAEATLEIRPLNDLPFFDEDVEAQGFPPSVQDLHARIAAADALLLAVPEYNYSIAPALKNAIDWASRPYGASVLAGKPAAIFGASAGMGTVRAQLHLRDVAITTGLHVLNQPEIFVGNAAAKFDDQLRLVDEPTRAIVARMLQRLVGWTRAIQSCRPFLESAA